MVWARTFWVFFLLQTAATTDVYWSRAMRNSSEDFLHYMHRVDKMYCLDFRNAFCDRYPEPDQNVINVAGSCNKACPKRCKCDSDCVKYNDCCPDVNNGTIMEITEGMYSCVSDHLTPSSNSRFYKLIAECPKHFTDTAVIKLCEKFQLSRELEDRKFVTSNESVTFVNKYCALCNGVEDFKMWRVKPSCTLQFRIPSSTPPEDIKNIIWENENCTFHVILPLSVTYVPLRACAADDSTIISQCNVTGLWPKYDADIESACLSYTHVFLNYRNPFCYLCNNYTAFVDWCAGSTAGYLTQFSAILDFGQVSYIQQPGCGRGFQYDALETSEMALEEQTTASANTDIWKKMKDPESHLCLKWSSLSKNSYYIRHGGRWPPNLSKTICHIGPNPAESPGRPNMKRCREVYCADGKWLKDNNTCVTVVRPRSGTYAMTIYYNTDIQLHNISCFNQTPKRDDFGAVVDEIRDRSTKLPELNNLKIVYSSAWVVLQRSETENCWDGPFVSPDKTIDYKAEWIKLELEFMWYGDPDVGVVEEKLFEFSVAEQTVSSAGFGHVTLKPERRSSSHEEMAFPLNALVIPIEESVSRMSAVPNVVSKQAFCPFVILRTGNGSYDVVRNNSQLHIPVLDYDVDPVDYSFVNSTHVRICSSPYFNRTDRLWNKNPPVDEVLVTISVVCTCISVLCLLITFIVYCLLKSLRTLPGKNNMSLIISLILAQLLFQFRPELGDGYEICVISGIATQYFWLATILWMNVCSFHMYRVFSRIRVVSKTSQTSDSKQLVLYALYCHLIPAVVVGITIAVSSSLFGELGYTSPICFLSNEYFLGLAFALPIALVVLANIIMFCIVVIAIYRSASSAKMVTSDKQYLHVYFRLSTITGATWVFGFIYQWTSNIVFSYIFTVLNALQGLFLFIAFVCNSRVCGSLRKQYLPKASEESFSLAKFYVKNKNENCASTLTRSLNVDSAENSPKLSRQ